MLQSLVSKPSSQKNSSRIFGSFFRSVFSFWVNSPLINKGYLKHAILHCRNWMHIAKSGSFEEISLSTNLGPFLHSTLRCVSVQDLPKGVHVCWGGEGEAVLVVTWAHPAHNLWRQITNPAVWKFQFVLAPEEKKKKKKGGGYTCFSKTWNREVDFSHRTLADRGRCLQDWSRCGPQQLLQITGPLQVIAVQCEQHSKLRFVFWRPLEWRFLPPFLNNSRDPKQPEVCDHDFIGVVENVLRLQVFVDNAFSVQVAHSLCRKKQTEMVREVLLLYQTGMFRFKLLLFTKGKKITFTISWAICLVLLISKVFLVSLTTEYSVLPLQKLQGERRKRYNWRLKTWILGLKPFFEMRLIFSPGDDGEVGWSHAGPHEEDHILVPGLSVVHHFLFEELQVVLIVPVDLEESDGHLAVPPALVHFAPAALNKRQLQLKKGHFGT